MALLPASRLRRFGRQVLDDVELPGLEAGDARTRLLDQLKSTVSNHTSLRPPKPSEPL